MSDCPCNGRGYIQRIEHGVVRATACAHSRSCGESGCDSFGVTWTCDGWHLERTERGDRIARCRSVSPRLDAIRRLDGAEIPAEYAEARCRDESLRALVTGAYLWGDPSPKPWPGPPHVGKTWLLCALARWAIQCGQAARYVSLPTLLGELQGAMDGEPPSWWRGRRTEPSPERVLQVYTEYPWLAIDELGKEKLSDWRGEMVWRLFDERYRAKRTTLVASNHSLSEVERRLGDRGRSVQTRIEDMCEQRRLT